MRSLEAAQIRPGTPARRRRPDRSGPCAAGRKGAGGGDGRAPAVGATNVSERQRAIGGFWGRGR
jgi:hypothetical protein